MATLHKFTTEVFTSKVDGEWASWINERDLPTEVVAYLRQRYPGEGTAWIIRLDKWFTPQLVLGEGIYRQTHTLALNDVTIPSVVNGDVDYSAWDD